MLSRALEISFSEILSECHTYSFKKMHFKMSSVRCRPFCLGFNVLMHKLSHSELIFAWCWIAMSGGFHWVQHRCDEISNIYNKRMFIITSSSSACYYTDVIMGTTASEITSLTVVYSTVYSDADQRKHQSPTSLAFVWGTHRGRCIPHTTGQLRGKCFHLMMSSSCSLYILLE